ncbi:MAG: DUF1934 domain-containing protein [Lactobacillales bacterium]|nr:DUF1934 domain-containing protein [Lactobacillales bacterium]
MELKNGIPVKIHLETKVRQDGETSAFVFNEPGQMVTVNGTIYLRYKEILEAEGQTLKTSVTMKIEPDGRLQIIRNGQVRMKLRFEYEKLVATSYRTPYGIFPITTYAKELHVSLKDTPLSGQVTLDYNLFAGEELLGEYELRLNFIS